MRPQAINGNSRIRQHAAERRSVAAQAIKHLESLLNTGTEDTRQYRAAIAELKRDIANHTTDQPELF